MNNATTQIADRVRGLAAEKRFTQQRIADTLGISRTSVVERFKGRVPFTATEVYRLATALGVEPSRFFPERASLLTPSPVAPTSTEVAS